MQDLSAQTIADRLTAAIIEGNLEEIAWCRMLQQCLPLQRLGYFLKEAEARAERWIGPLERTRAEYREVEMELRQQEVKFCESFLAFSLDKDGNTIDRRLPGDTRKDLRASVLRLNFLMEKMKEGHESACNEVQHIRELIRDFASDPVLEPANGWDTLFYSLWEKRENADRNFRMLTQEEEANDPFAPFMTVSTAA